MKLPGRAGERAREGTSAGSLGNGASKTALLDHSKIKVKQQTVATGTEVTDSTK